MNDYLCFRTLTRTVWRGSGDSPPAPHPLGSPTPLLSTPQLVKGDLPFPPPTWPHCPNPWHRRSPAPYMVSPFTLGSPWSTSAGPLGAPRRVPAPASIPPNCAPPQRQDALPVLQPRAPPAPAQSWRGSQNRAGYREPGARPEPITVPDWGTRG